ncbi:hypothetical protein [Pseudoalteromonas ostreae]|uniref:hypothetical protein n=1 Tax=Pseudoalteromonas ostreae TaxID=2774154 RepID=UPI001B392911|nr:hypothetical protein [Pseudoalteromonas ostreae]
MSKFKYSAILLNFSAQTSLQKIHSDLIAANTPSSQLILFRLILLYNEYGALDGYIAE